MPTRLAMLTFTGFILLFSGCSLRNPFVPPSGTVTYSEAPCDPIATDPMYRATMRPYTVMGKRYCPTIVKVGDTFSGTASWYGDDFHGKQTSNGEYYNMYALTAAHKTLPINTIVRVTNLKNNRSTQVRINDRGPFVEERIIDLSYKAASDIGMVKHGTSKVRLEVVEFDESALKYAHKSTPIYANPTPAPTRSVWKRYDEQQQVAATPAPKQQLQAVGGGEYTIQIASLTSKLGAEGLREKCYNANGRYTPTIKEVTINNQRIYKVMLAGFESVEEAKDFIDQAHYQGAFIVRD